MEVGRHINQNNSILSMLQKLNMLYDREEALKKEIGRLMTIYNQLQEDKQLLQTIIMHQSNKQHRTNIGGSINENNNYNRS